jgi:aldehyde dehydrogenase (NAD+)
MTSQPLAPQKLLIGGQWLDAASGQSLPTLNPATEEELTTLAAGGPEDVERAVAAARTAFEGKAWSRMSARARGQILWKIGDLVSGKYLDELARLETLDNGKPIFESKYVDIPMVANVFRYYAGWADKVCGQTVPVDGPFFGCTLRDPVGVVGAITAWNFPLLLASWKVAPALACGNTVVLKPAETSSLTCLKLGEIALEAGLPPGCLNVLTGLGPEVGAPLVEHPGVDKIAFTGSTQVGQEIARRAAGTVKRVSLELGGKSPNIVLADADFDAAVKGAVNGLFYGKGEVCAAGSRLFVDSSIHDRFVETLLGSLGRYEPADPLDDKTRMGALNSQRQLEKVQQYVEIGKKEGALLAHGGERASVGSGKGYFFRPTVFTGATNDMSIARDEIFGPILTTIRVSSLEEALVQANQSPYGLAAAIWTNDVKKALRAVQGLRAGTVWVNAYNYYDPAMPFGGYRQSGFGRELGEKALELYTETKSVFFSLR